jgi:hypothetical protein
LAGQGERIVGRSRRKTNEKRKEKEEMYNDCDVNMYIDE